MRLALFQPDIPQNVGTMLRMAACLRVPVDLIEPCGFIFDDKRLRRSGMDYLDLAALQRHTSWQAFARHREEQSDPGRMVLLSTKAAQCYTDFAFRPNDTLMVGRESAGVPDEVHESADARLIIPMAAGARSLNVAVSAAMVLGEALRQTGGFPDAQADL